MPAATLAVAKPEIWDTLPGFRILHVVEAFDMCRVDVRPSLARFDMPSPLKNDTAVSAPQAAEWLEYVLGAYPQRGFGLFAPHSLFVFGNRSKDYRCQPV